MSKYSRVFPQLRPIFLGRDALGDEYVYFAAFCGEDVRIYKQRQFGEYDFLEVPEPTITVVKSESTADQSSGDNGSPENKIEKLRIVNVDDTNNESDNEASLPCQDHKPCPSQDSEALVASQDSEPLDASQDSEAPAPSQSCKASTPILNCVNEGECSVMPGDGNPTAINHLDALNFIPDERASQKSLMNGGGDESDASTVSYHGHAMSDASSQQDTFQTPKKRSRTQRNFKDITSQEETSDGLVKVKILT